MQDDNIASAIDNQDIDYKAMWAGTPMSRLREVQKACPDSSLDDCIAGATVSHGTWMYEHAESWRWHKAVVDNGFKWRDVVRVTKPKSYPFY